MTSLLTKFRSSHALTNVVALAVGLYQFYVAPIPGANPLYFGLAVSLINVAFHAKQTPAPVK